MKRYVKFLKYIVDPEGNTVWEKDKEYEVKYESDKYYQISSELVYDCGIDKKSKNIRYIIIEK